MIRSLGGNQTFDLHLLTGKYVKNILEDQNMQTNIVHFIIQVGDAVLAQVTEKKFRRYANNSMPGTEDALSRFAHQRMNEVGTSKCAGNERRSTAVGGVDQNCQSFSSRVNVILTDSERTSVANMAENLAVSHLSQC